jgi:hypothetical protein
MRGRLTPLIDVASRCFAMLARRTSRSPLRQRLVPFYRTGWPAVGAPSAAASKPSWKIGMLALAPVLLVGACTAGTVSSAKMRAVTVGGFEQQLDQACGQPIAYPLTPQCLALMGSVGPLLEHRSVLVMKIWRSCPQDNPCYRIIKTEPACAGQTLPAVSDHGGGANDPCLRAQEANYSCAALRNDLAYLERTRAGSDALYDECDENKRALAEYDQRIEQMSVLIQWYRSFADKGF